VGTYSLLWWPPCNGPVGAEGKVYMVIDVWCGEAIL